MIEGNVRGVVSGGILQGLIPVSRKRNFIRIFLSLAVDSHGRFSLAVALALGHRCSGMLLEADCTLTTEVTHLFADAPEALRV